MEQITKLCADSLRTFVNDHYNIKLKPTHAHELVAAYFGYKSNAAMRADMVAPITNLRQASILVLAPTAPIDLRRQELEGLSTDLPDTYTLGEGVYSPLISEKWITSTPWPVFELLAKALADEHLRLNNLAGSYRSPVREGVKIERREDSVQLIVLRSYQLFMTSSSVQEVKITTSINLPRIAGHIGYGKPEVSVDIESGVR